MTKEINSKIITQINKLQHLILPYVDEFFEEFYEKFIGEKECYYQKHPLAYQIMNNEIIEEFVSGRGELHRTAPHIPAEIYSRFDDRKLYWATKNRSDKEASKYTAYYFSTKYGALKEAVSCRLPRKKVVADLCEKFIKIYLIYDDKPMGLNHIHEMSDREIVPEFFRLFYLVDESDPFIKAFLYRNNSHYNCTASIIYSPTLTCFITKEFETLLSPTIKFFCQYDAQTYVSEVSYRSSTCDLELDIENLYSNSKFYSNLIEKPIKSYILTKLQDILSIP